MFIKLNSTGVLKDISSENFPKLVRILSQTLRINELAQFLSISVHCKDKYVKLEALDAFPSAHEPDNKMGIVQVFVFPKMSLPIYNYTMNNGFLVFPKKYIVYD